MFSAKILCDSVNPCGNRLTTFELTYPRFIHAEFLTHRAFSRNSASSRAIPVEKMIERVMINPVIPIHWGKAQPGMQAYEEVEDWNKADCQSLWLEARDFAVRQVRELLEKGLHKQIANRLLEPWMHITVIASTTNMSHFLSLRKHPAAEPHFQRLAELMAEAYEASNPQVLCEGEWHLPLIDTSDYVYAHGLIEHTVDIKSNRLPEKAREELVKISVGRCARVSYLTHDGIRDHNKDIELHERLVSSDPGHWSPAEHPARALSKPERHGNFVGWLQYRKLFPSREYLREKGEC